MRKMADVAIIGAGSWGIALAKVLHTNGNKVTVWSIVEDEITMLKEKHEHVQKLPGVKLPEDMEFTTDLESAVSGKAYLILAVPSVFTRSTAKSMAPFVKEGQIIVCVAKRYCSYASGLFDPATGRDVPNDPAEHRSVPFLRLPAAGRKLRVRTPVPNGLRRTFFPRREREI